MENEGKEGTNLSSPRLGLEVPDVVFPDIGDRPNDIDNWLKNASKIE